ncbi:MAG: class I SAM-dependent methyltransferase [Candidatus Aegiribacteria sp.]|nr:class I SAM-dependent methyltransferase [Candidatus Aegiribacteria sp.]
MDSYTHDMKLWLDQRFRMTDKEGIYHAHQPIYGFRKGHSEPGTIARYIITYQIMKTLSHLEFTSLLDVGGAEGYKAALARLIFNASVRSADLSGEACSRAKEIFDVDGEPVDVHQLPYNDNEFDVVLCNETLEHVPDLHKATNELIRVCSKAVIITVPHEPKEFIEDNIKEKIPHSHIHCFDTDSFDFVLPGAVKVISRRFLNPYLKLIAGILDAMKIEQSKNYPQFLVNNYNSCLPLFRLVFGLRSAGMLMRLDDYISNLMPSYSGMSFILLKDENCYSTHQKKHITTQQIINFKVPYYYLR